MSSDEEVDVRELEALRALQGKARRPGARRNPAIDNVVGLRRKLKELELPPEWPWIERCSFTSKEAGDEIVPDVHDDLAREASFYRSTLSAVKSAVEQLDQSGIPYKRPRDFYAEMVKTDAHLARVKQVLLGERRRMDAVADRKKQRDLKKFAKRKRASVLADKAKAKRELDHAVSRFRKGTKHNEVRVGAAELEDALAGKKRRQPRPDAAGPGDRPRGGARGGPNDARRKRQKKDDKFGTGYAGRRSKSNDGKSAADMSEYRGGTNGKGKKGKRPGKDARRRAGR